MPKMKTHKASAKRFRLTATGKVKRTNANGSHLMSGMSAKRRRKIRKPGLASNAESKAIATAIRH